MKATALINTGNNNFQIDFYGYDDETCMTHFRNDCIKREVIWGHLFDQSNGRLIGSYYGNKEDNHGTK